jgi:hypothetical protein
MKIFALETNIEKALRSFLAEGEKELFVIRFHPFKFFFRLIRLVFMTLLLAAVAVGLEYLRMPLTFTLIAFFAAFIFWILPGIVRAYIDWRFDALVVTNDHVIIIDQTSIFHQEVRQMHLENFASVSAVTQFWNLFPFGMLCFDLKEGVGQRLKLSYVPDAQAVALRISNCVRAFQRSSAPAQQAARPEAVS